MYQVAADLGLRSDFKRYFYSYKSSIFWFRVLTDLFGHPFSGGNSSYPKHDRGYTGRVASSEQKVRALARAQELRGNLKNNHPSFVKPVTRSHVSTCFRLVS